MTRSIIQPGIRRALLSAAMVLSLGGCLGGDTLNTETTSYTPEQKPLNVIAPDNIEVVPGSSVTLTSRLVGTVSGQTLRWTQIGGASVFVENPDTATVTIDIPASIISDKLIFEVAAMNSDGTPATGADGQALVDVVEVTVFDPASVIQLDVSDDSTTLSSASLVRPGDEQYVGGANEKVHTADLEPGQSVVFNINDNPGFFTLTVRYVIPSDYGGKVGNALVNGVLSEFQLDATGQWTELRIGVVKLNEGNNTIEVGGGWSYYRIDSISLIPAAEPAAPLPVSPTLNNPNASESTIALMTYLTENYVSKTLSGQTEFPTNDGSTNELVQFGKVTAATGDDAPAIVAYDYMEYSQTRVANGANPGSLTEDMIKHHQERNVILSPLWHWNAPMHLIDSADQPWYRGFYASATTFDLAAALADTTSAEYLAILTDIDRVAVELKKLQDADIPVLWRPLHEADGDWFWWSSAGSDGVKALWHLMFDRMTNMHGLNNLIWVFTHSNRLELEYYPGDEYVDIVGFDGYDGNNDQNTFASAYNTLKGVHNGNKLLALTETGAIPDVEAMHQVDAWWSYFVTWNSGNDANLGPDAMEPAVIDENYAYDGLINLADLPGGQAKIEAGGYADFDVSTSGFEAQVNWSPTTGLETSDKWAASGARALSVTKNLSAEDGPTSVILQTYPEGGIDATGVTTLALNAHALNAGADTTIKLWAKDADGVWRDAGATPIEDGGVALSIDVSDIDNVQGFGLQIENFDVTAAAAEFYLDNVTLDGSVIYDFEPETSGFESQINWSPTPGLTVTNDWASSGARALTIIKDLNTLDGPTDVIFQTYPEGGIDVSGISMLHVSAHTVGAGDATTIKLWAKDADGVWRDAGETLTASDGVELSLDVSDIDVMQGFGLQIRNFDPTAVQARFYFDNVRLDDTGLFDFEGTGEWEFQVNWSPAEGLQLSSDWQDSADSALSGKTQLIDGDDNIILQTYPEGGLLLGDVSTLHVTAHAINAGDAVTAQLWAKDGEGNWRDEGAFPVSADGVALSVNISDWSAIQGFGVRFQGAVNSGSESQYFIDSVVFE